MRIMIKKPNRRMMNQMMNIKRNNKKICLKRIIKDLNLRRINSQVFHKPVIKLRRFQVNYIIILKVRLWGLFNEKLKKAW